MYDFNNLHVYQESKDLYIEVYKLITTKLRKEFILKDQLNRATLSICLNLAEGSGKRTFKDKSRYYTIARASSYECAALFEILNEVGILSVDEISYYNRQLDKITKMLYNLIRSQQKY